MAEAGDVDEWKPPTEAEMKVLSARRERQEKISKLMGQYLLKGYKMLGETCDACGTILLRDKQGVDFCVACKELTSDTDKDNPVLNEEAAASQVREVAASTTTTEYSADADSGLHYVDLEPIANAAPQPLSEQQLPNISAAATRLLSRLQQPSRGNDMEISGIQSFGVSSPSAPNNRSALMTATAVVIESRLQWANSQLSKATNAEQIMALCDVIQKLLSTLQQLSSMGTT